MAELSEKQRTAIDKLQSQQTDITEDERRQFIQGIISVPKHELPEGEKSKKKKRPGRPKKGSS